MRKATKCYKFGDPWPDWAWILVVKNQIVIQRLRPIDGPFDHQPFVCFVYGKQSIEIAYIGDYLIYDGQTLKVKANREEVDGDD